MVYYNALSIYRGHISLNISPKTPHSSPPVRARYGVSFMNAKYGRSCAVVTVVLCALSCYRWSRYIKVCSVVPSSMQCWMQQYYVILHRAVMVIECKMKNTCRYQCLIFRQGLLLWCDINRFAHILQCYALAFQHLFLQLIFLAFNHVSSVAGWTHYNFTAGVGG